MQISKHIARHCETWNFAVLGKVCISKQSLRITQKKSQNLLEFVFILPMIIFITLVIMEVALFWQDVNAIYNLNAEINANIALLNYSNLTLGSVCPAADTGEPNSAISILNKRSKMISMSDTIFTGSAIDGANAPFVLYKFTGGPMITPSPIDGVAQAAVPQLQLWVDCRNPFEDGVTTQIEFYHKTLVMKATIPRFDKPEGIVIIPDKIFIASPKLNTLRHY